MADDALKEAARRELLRRRAAAELNRRKEGGGRVGTVGGMAAAAVDGLTFGAGDEILAGLSAVTGLQPDGEGGARFLQYDRPMGERYSVALDAIRDEQQQFKEDRPVAAIGAEIAGGIIGPGKAVKGAQSVWGAVGRAAGYGAAGGGVYAFGEGEGGVQERLSMVPVGVGAGAAGGIVMVPLARVVSSVRNALGEKVAKVLENSSLFRDGDFTGRGVATLRRLGVAPEQVKRAIAGDVRRLSRESVEEMQGAADLQEFGIPAYRKDVTGSVDDAAFYQGALRGKQGDAAQRRIASAETAQREAARAAGDDLARGLSPGRVQADAGDAAAAVQGRVRATADTMKTAADDAYAAADAARMTVDARAVKGAAPRIETRLADLEIDLDPATTPNAYSIVQAIKRRGTGESAPVSLRRLDSMRKRMISSLQTAKGEDSAALAAVKAEYDAWADDVITAGLFDGDADAIRLLKEARGAFAEYAKQFRGKDKASKFLQQMVDADATPDDVAKWLFSAGKMGSGKLNSTIANSLRDTMGADSVEWGMIRQAAFRKLIEAPEGSTQPGYEKIAQNVTQFLNGPTTRDLARSLYSAEERAMMLRYASAMRRLTPPAGSVNYSGTGYENARSARQIMQALAGTVATAGTGGNPVAGAAAAQATSTMQNVRGFLQAQAALKGVVPRYDFQPGARGGAVGGAVAGATTAQVLSQQE